MDKNLIADQKQKLEEFKTICDNFSQIGEDLALIVWGKDNNQYLEWRQKRHNFEEWIKEALHLNFS